MLWRETRRPRKATTASWLLSAVVQPAGAGGDHPFVPGTGEVTAQCIVGPLTTVQTWRSWRVSGDGQRSCEGSGAAGGTGMGHTETEEAQGRPHHSPQLPEWGLW